jgi:hypothetical protein
VNQASYEGFGEALQCGLEQGWWTIHPSDIFLSARARAIVALAAQYRLPAVYPVPTFAEFGGLLAYGPDFFITTSAPQSWSIVF